MKVNRKELLDVLTTASVGITKREVLEQSNSFIVDSENLITFNGEIFTKVASPLPDVSGSVPAEDLLALLAKFPDEELEVHTLKNELRVKGKKREAGITMSADVHLPFDDVPGPDVWTDVPEALPSALVQAARICGRDEALPRTMEVHVTPDWVEASDNYRIFRSTITTGLKGEVLFPGTSIEMVGNLVFKKLSQPPDTGWIHFQTKKGHQVSIRCSKGKYPDLGKFLEVGEGKKVVLPENLSEILSRAEVMQDFNAIVGVVIEDGLLTLSARKDQGWYKESKSIDYDTVWPPIKFEVNLRFLQEILKTTRKVTVSENRMRIRSGETTFVVCLETGE